MGNAAAITVEPKRYVIRKALVEVHRIVEYGWVGVESVCC